MSHICPGHTLKSMVSLSACGMSPLYIVHVKPVADELLFCAATTGKQGYLNRQVSPAPHPQDISTIPSEIRRVIDNHKQTGGTLGPVPPHTTAAGFEMHIDMLPGAKPRAARQYRLTPIEKPELEEQVERLIDMGWVKPSVSPWASSILGGLSHRAAAGGALHVAQGWW